MSRIPRLGRSQVSGAVRDVFERKIAERGNIPNIYRVFAHRPWLLSTLDAHSAAVMGSGTVPLKLKEMLALQTSLANACESATSLHGASARRLGATEEQIAALLNFEDGPFDEKERVALAYGLQVARDAHGVSEELFDELASHFDAGEIVEITCVVGFVTYVSRVADALQIAPTQPEEGVTS